jgi:predicted nucleic acid-binding protein
LLLPESTTPAALAALAADDRIYAWWATEVECVSAVARAERNTALTPEAAADALRRLDRLVANWDEIGPTVTIRAMARRLLRVHPLRAADALQLAAAIAAAEGRPRSLGFVTLDRRLGDAAQREGFPVLDLRDAA